MCACGCKYTFYVNVEAQYFAPTIKLFIYNQQSPLNKHHKANKVICAMLTII